MFSEVRTMISNKIKVIFVILSLLLSAQAWFDSSPATSIGLFAWMMVVGLILTPQGLKYFEARLKAGEPQ
jgi:hypothetical protein